MSRTTASAFANFFSFARPHFLHFLVPSLLLWALLIHCASLAFGQTLEGSVVSGGVIVGLSSPLEHSAPTVSWRGGIARPLQIDPLPAPDSHDFSVGAGWSGASTIRNPQSPLSWIDVRDVELAMTGTEGGTALGTNFSAKWFGYDWHARAGTTVPGLPMLGDPAGTWFRAPDLKLRLTSPF